MTLAIRTITRLQDADDAPALGAGQDGHALTWDNASGAFVGADLVLSPTPESYTLENVQFVREFDADTGTLGDLANLVAALVQDLQTLSLTALVFRFTDYFNRDDGALGNGWTGANAAVSSNAAVITPTLGSNLADNGGMENPYNTSGTLEIASGWDNFLMVSDVDTAAKEAGTVHGGSASQKIVASASIRGVICTQYFKMTIGAWYEISTWVYITSGSVRIITGTMIGGIHARDITTTGEWVNVKLTGRATAAEFNIYIYSLESATYYIDDITLKAITIGGAFALREGESAYSWVKAKVTANPVTFSGVVECANALSDPTDAVVAYIDGQSKIIVDKIVSGVWSNVLAPTTISYVAGRTVELRHTALNTFQVYYNDIQIGTDLTISDAGIVSNVYHGMFSLNGGNSLDNFFLSVPS